MKILALVKRDAVYKVEVRVRSDASGVDLANVKMAMNPFVEIAVEEAVRLKESGLASEVIAVSCWAGWRLPGNDLRRDGHRCRPEEILLAVSADAFLIHMPEFHCPSFEHRTRCWFSLSDCWVGSE